MSEITIAPGDGIVIERAEVAGRPATVRSRMRGRTGFSLSGWLPCAAALGLACVLNLTRLGQEGYGNTYYAAAVKSMLGGWHTFFFASFDPAGFVSVDKPPVGLWIQVASAALLGFQPVALFLPQALAGIASVAIVMALVGRVFGRLAAAIAGLAYALAPVSVAVNRNNTMDATLIVTLLLAAWAVTRATERGSLRWLLAGFGLLAVGFAIKMLQAFMVLPALGLLYLVAAPAGVRRGLVHLALATALMVAGSLAWPLAVDLTPPDQRPYVGSSASNTVMGLILGHNGLERVGRVAARFLRPAPLPPGPDRQPVPGAQPGPSAPSAPGAVMPSGPGSSTRPGGPQSGAAGGQPGAPGLGVSSPPAGAADQGRRPDQEIGTAGPLRLFSRQLGGQISWLLVPAALMGLGLAWRPLLRWRMASRADWWSWLTRPSLGRRGSAVLLWSAWLLPQVVFFSWAQLFHRYYLAMLSPAVAALFAIGVIELWRAFRRDEPQAWTLPVAMVAGGSVQAALLSHYPEWAPALVPVAVGLPLTGAVLLIAARLRRLPSTWSSAAVAAGVLGLLVAPAVWSATPVIYRGDTTLPFAGPELAGGRLRPLLRRPAGSGVPAPAPDGVVPGGAVPRNGSGLPGALAGAPNGPGVGAASPGMPAGPGGSDAPSGAGGPGGLGALGTNQRLIEFLRRAHNGERYVLATLNAMTAAPVIIATGEPVMALGGFSGADRILTVPQLQAKVAAREVRFFLLPGTSETQTGRQLPLIRWVEARCSTVPVQVWRGTTGTGPQNAPGAPNAPGVPAAPTGRNPQGAPGAPGGLNVPNAPEAPGLVRLWDCGGPDVRPGP